MIQIFNSYARKDEIRSIVVAHPNLVFVNLKNGAYISQSFDNKKKAEKAAKAIADKIE